MALPPKANVPTSLQRAVSHAERLRATLPRAIQELRLRGTFGESAALWFLGRDEELAVLVADVVHDWQAGRADTWHATRVIDEYVARIHRGLREHGVTRRPRFCSPEAATEDVDVPALFNAATAER